MMHIDGAFLKDGFGRTLMLRGVNLGANAKIPHEPYLATHLQFGLYDNKKLSFVNRPFPLKHADEHFKRLKSWGFTFLRFLVTWEAIEHQAPDIYDRDYLDYVYQIIAKAKEYDIQVFIDPHQDVWSRFSGGDGAPRWTFEKVGLDIRHFNESGAAILHQAEGDNYEDMIWVTNYTKLATATMFTLFFAGNDFAPNLMIDGINAQDYLQNHYINAFKQLAIRLKDLDNVVGFDIMNEPSKGWIGWKDLNSHEFPLKKGASPTPFESMLLASGNPVKVENWVLGASGLKKKGKIEINSRAVKAWINGFKCIWKNHGVWDVNKQGEFVLQKPEYFSIVRGKKVNFNQDYLRPFVNKYAKAIREAMPNSLIFIENAIQETPPLWGMADTKNIVYAPHWYDFLTLFTKKFRTWFNFDVETGKVVWGKKKIRKMFAEQLAHLKKNSHDFLMNAPVFIGELGIPMDMNKKKSFRSDNFKKQINALDTSMRAVEDNLLHVTIWNYNPDNSNEFGDLWNKEDLSIFSKDQQTNPSDINSGGRALKALLRPYPMKIAGIPLRISFDIKKAVFEFEFEHDSKVKQATEIYVPLFHYPNGFKVTVSDGNYDIDESKQLLLYYHSIEKSKHSIRIAKN